MLLLWMARPSSALAEATRALDGFDGVHRDVSTTMISTHLLKRGGRGVRSPLDGVR
jgi:hypothetical protein